MDKIECSDMKIISRVQKADLQQICKPTSGNCVEVAVAISEVFEVDSYYVALEPRQKPTRPTHIAVVKDGTIIDGTGEVSKERMREYATSGLKREEVKRADWGPASLSLFENCKDSQGLTNEIIRKLRKKI